MANRIYRVIAPLTDDEKEAARAYRPMPAGMQSSFDLKSNIQVLYRAALNR
jgi:hypothetical protein